MLNTIACNFENSLNRGESRVLEILAKTREVCSNEHTQRVYPHLLEYFEQINLAIRKMQSEHATDTYVAFPQDCNERTVQFITEYIGIFRYTYEDAIKTLYIQRKNFFTTLFL